jgi:hypothetical protein
MTPTPRPLGPDADGQWVRRWTSPEWTRDADAWVDCRLADVGRRISGTPVTYRARFWSVVRCYPSAEGLVWLKENNPGHRFEAGLVILCFIAMEQLDVSFRQYDHEQALEL